LSQTVWVDLQQFYVLALITFKLVYRKYVTRKRSVPCSCTKYIRSVLVY